MKYSLPKLPYQYSGLEPFIDAKTVEIHYTKHHQTYVDKLNAVLENYPELADQKLEVMLSNLKTLKMNENDKIAFKNSAGGHLNHSLYWSNMDRTKSIDNELNQRIIKTFGSLEIFKKLLGEAALNRFGSGWGWLVETPKKELLIYSTPNQDSPYLNGDTPIIGLDVWEHAYYLKYQNRRAEYIENWWKVLKLV
jgi:superoxide dismutase, Fe-Mn family